MFNAVANIFKIPELRTKIFFTLGLLCIYRIGFHVPVPGIDQEALRALMGEASDDPLGQIANYMQIFTGGSLSQSSLFSLGIMPYISASIIFQLLVTVIPSLEKLQKEGEVGRKKIQEYTRYLTVGLCIIQSFAILIWLANPGNNIVYQEILREHRFLFFLMGVLSMTAGTVFLMWLGEQIDEYGIGNGISLIIMAGIVANMPWAVMQVWGMTNFSIDAGANEINPAKLIFLVAAFLAVVAGAILITQGQRRIPIQMAKITRGRRTYGGQRQYLPLRVNHGGVMPIIFAVTLMQFPTIVLGQLQRVWQNSLVLNIINDAFSPTSFIYNFIYILMIYFFAYFWTTVQFQPKEMANNLRDYGHFIPGLRPGRRTAEYLEKVMARITYVGAAFLSLIAVVPTLIIVWLDIPFNVAQFLGGTGLLIVVSVSLDLVQRIETNLIMRNYSGFMEGGRIKGAYA